MQLYFKSGKRRKRLQTRCVYYGMHLPMQFTLQAVLISLCEFNLSLLIHGYFPES